MSGKDCTDKVTYRTEQAARKTRRNSGGKLFTTTPYKCRWCGFWHLGNDRRTPPVKVRHLEW